MVGQDEADAIRDKEVNRCMQQLENLGGTIRTTRSAARAQAARAATAERASGTAEVTPNVAAESTAKSTTADRLNMTTDMTRLGTAAWCPGGVMKAFGDTTKPTEAPTDTAEETTMGAVFTMSYSPESLTPDSTNDESTPAVKLPATMKALAPGGGRAEGTRRTEEDMSEREPSLQRAIKEYVGRQLQQGNKDWRKQLLCPFSCEGQTDIKAHASTDKWELWCELYGLCIDSFNNKTGEVVCYGHCHGLLGLVAHCKKNK